MTTLVRRPFTVVDGGLSTALEELGEHPSGLLWTAATLLERPHVVTEAHRRYVEAGADIVISASYQATEAGFMGAGLSATAARALLASTTEVARASGAPMVAASVGPFGATLGDGSEYRGDYVRNGVVSWDGLRAFHRARLEVLVDSGPDLFAIETMPLREEAEIVVEELRRLTDLPAWVTFSCVDEAHVCGGDTVAAAAAAVAGSVEAVGVNCTKPRFVEALLRSVDVGLPLVVYPNHGADWDADHECWVGPTGGVELPSLVPAWLDAGARIIGGCCGVGPEGIRRVAALRDRS